MRVDELTGASIGRYRVGGRLQVLPYATVYRATTDAKPVLVWTFQEPYATSAGFMEALQRLAGDDRAMRVPGLLHVLEIGSQELRSPVVYLVTEDAPSGFLVSLLQAGRAPGVFATTVRLARALDQMHALGMVHGDIQPATVAVAGAGPVLAGHAIRTVVSRVTPEAAWVDITRAFRPPEAESGAEQSKVDDLWGLAALVYYLLVGRPPAPGGSPEPPGRLRPQLPARVDRAVMRALATDPAQRFSSAFDFYAALRGTVSGPANQPAGAPASPPVRPTPAAADGPVAAPTLASQSGFPAASPSERQPYQSPAGSQTPVPAASSASPLWPTEAPLTPATLRAQALPFRSDDSGTDSTPSTESTQLIAVEPYRFEPKFRRRGGYVLLWILVLAVVVAAVLLVTGQLGI
ncbi:MAG TPA: hypothetical protein VI138_05805 [Candidatus Dormibacteraeota bacterium]